MTWNRVQALTEALLSGDHTLIKDTESRLALLSYAYEEIANISEVLTLEEVGTGVNAIREGFNDGTYVRRANLPSSNDDELDIDDGLAFAVARLMASYVSKEKFSIHRDHAIDLINTYNRKVYSMRDKNNE